MTVLNDVAAVAGAILLLELFVVVAIFLAVSGGLAFGLRWVNGKTEWAFGKVNGFLPQVRKYRELGLDYAGKPFILAGGWWSRGTTTLLAIRQTVRGQRVAWAHAHEVAARPVLAPEEPAETLVLP